MATPTESILALDVGEKRVGVALADKFAKLPKPLTTLLRGDNFLPQLAALINEHNVVKLIVGLPRNMKGQETKQTQAIRVFVRGLQDVTHINVYFQDETLTSKKAETELLQRGVPYNKGHVDALAATYILEDYLRGSV